MESAPRNHQHDDSTSTADIRGATDQDDPGDPLAWMFTDKSPATGSPLADSRFIL